MAAHVALFLLCNHFILSAGHNIARLLIKGMRFKSKKATFHWEIQVQTILTKHRLKKRLSRCSNEELSREVTREFARSLITALCECLCTKRIRKPAWRNVLL